MALNHKKKIRTKPLVSFYCFKCNLFFNVEGETLLDEVTCPECKTNEVFLELEFGENKPNYFT